MSVYMSMSCAFFGNVLNASHDSNYVTAIFPHEIIECKIFSNSRITQPNVQGYYTMGLKYTCTLHAAFCQPVPSRAYKNPPTFPSLVHSVHVGHPFAQVEASVFLSVHSLDLHQGLVGMLGPLAPSEPHKHSLAVQSWARNSGWSLKVTKAACFLIHVPSHVVFPIGRSSLDKKVR